MGEKRSYRVCSRCVMDTTHADIVFDENGVCNYCYEYEIAARALLPEPKRSKKLNEIIATIKTAGKKKEYDCILGVSGGVDSSYLACKLKEFGLRTLAVQFDNGWNSELAVKNIEMLCKKLEIDLFTYVVDWEEFRDLQLSFLKASVANVEAPSDHGIFATLFQVADKHNIKYIVNGNNLVTEQIRVLDYGHSFWDLSQIRGIHAIYGNRKLKTFPQISFWKRLYFEKIKGIKSISLLNYMPYNKRCAKEFLNREMGWRDYGGKHHESIITRFHQTFILMRKFGVDKRRGHLSNLIFSGQLTRDVALEELHKPPCPPSLIEEDLEYVIKKLGLTDSEFEKIMTEPPKSYRDYPNEEWLYDFYRSLVSVKSRLQTVISR